MYVSTLVSEFGNLNENYIFLLSFVKYNKQSFFLNNKNNINNPGNTKATRCTFFKSLIFKRRVN